MTCRASRLSSQHVCVRGIELPPVSRPIFHQGVSESLCQGTPRRNKVWYWLNFPITDSINPLLDSHARSCKMDWLSQNEGFAEADLDRFQFVTDAPFMVQTVKIYMDEKANSCSFLFNCTISEQGIDPCSRARLAPFLKRWHRTRSIEIGSTVYALLPLLLIKKSD